MRANTYYENLQVKTYYEISIYNVIISNKSYFIFNKIINSEYFLTNVKAAIKTIFMNY
jgi:hypothetical protein